MLIPSTTSLEAWSLPEKGFALLSKSHLKNIRDKLRSLKKKSDQPIDDYLLDAKYLSDAMAAAGSPLVESEFLDFVTDDLGHEYKEFITSLNFRPSITFDEMYEFLLQESSLIKRLTPSTVTNDTTLITTTQPNQQNFGNLGRGRGQGGGRNCGRGRGRGGRHYHHSQPFFNYNSSTPPLLPTPPSINTSIACQICNKFGHTTRVCYERHNHAYITQPYADSMSQLSLQSPTDGSWCIDSGATQHMSNTSLKHDRHSSLLKYSIHSGRQWISSSHYSHWPFFHSHCQWFYTSVKCPSCSCTSQESSVD